MSISQIVLVAGGAGLLLLVLALIATLSQMDDDMDEGAE